jgi:transcriptional regulator with XRE-family HTH domain
VSAFGEQLRQAREARGLSLEAVAEATRIAPHHLKALERSDLAALPAGPFAKGYIEACAKVLDVDPEPILEAYRAEARQSGLDAAGAQSRTIDELGQLVGQRAGTDGQPGRARAGRRLAIAVIVAVALGVVGWLALCGRTPESGVGDALRPTGADRHGSDGGPVGAVTDAGTPPGSALPRVLPTPTPSPTVAVANPNIEIPDFGVGTGVESHRLVGAGDRFGERTEVVFWTHVVGGDPGDVILHVWLHEGRGIARIPLRIGSPSWRTHSLRPLPLGSAGRWTAEARTPDGRLLARQEFMCVPPGR